MDCRICAIRGVLSVLNRGKILGNVSSTNNKRRLWTVSFSLLILVGIVTSNVDSGSIDSRLIGQARSIGIEVDSEEFRAVHKAWKIVEPGGNTVLVSVGRIDTRWVVEFEKNMKYRIQIELRSGSHEMIFLSDESKRPRGDESWDVTAEQAIMITQRFLEKLALNGYSDVSDRVLGSVRNERNCWRIGFLHRIGEHNVKNDFISVRVNPVTGAICSFAASWGRPDMTHHTILDEREMLAVFDSIFETNHDFEPTLEIGLVSADFGGEGRLLRNAWVVAAIAGGVCVEYWFDAANGALIGSNQTLGGSFGSAYCGGTAIGYGSPDISWQIANEVHDRLRTDNYDSELDYYVTPTDLDFAFNYDEVVLFVGHCDHSGYPLLSQYLVTSYGFYGSEHLPMYINSKLFFACACGSALSESWFGNSLPERALLAGLDCYCGWVIDINVELAKEFVKFFFDKAVLGETFYDCKDYAVAKTSVIPSDFSVLGDGNAHLEVWDITPSFCYDSQKYDHDVGQSGWAWYINDEPLWCGDIDALKHNEDISHNIELMVTPSDEMYVNVKVYYWFSDYKWLLYAERTSTSPRDSISMTWGSGPKEYLIVISSTSSPHGGYYDLDFWCQS